MKAEMNELEPKQYLTKHEWSGNFSLYCLLNIFAKKYTNSITINLTSNK